MNVTGRPLERLSLAGRSIAVIGALMVVAWPVAAGLNPALLAPLLPPGVTVEGAQRWAALGASLVPGVLFLGAMIEAFRLFGLLGRGEAFSTAMPRSLERLALWALASAIAGVVTPTLIGLIATADAAEGQRQLLIRFGSGEITGLIVALLLLAFGRVMREAMRVARENREFV